MDILTQIFELVLFPLLGIGTTYLIVLINTKIKELKQKTGNEILNFYLEMLNTTIIDCVKATNQTYVNNLKEQGQFDAEAQKEAFKKTYEAVFKILAADAKEYLEAGLNDLQGYVTEKIEAQVNDNKSAK